MAAARTLLIGTYQRLGGEGIVAATIVDDSLVVGPRYGALEDCSFGIWSHSSRLYTVAEQPEGRIRALLHGPSGLVLQSQARSGGDAPCHLALDPAGQLLAVANYESGSVGLFRLDPDGALADAHSSHHQLIGSGPHPERQAGPHAHWVGFAGDGSRLYCVDLGSDAILRFVIDPERPSLERPTIAYCAPPGSGPRHLAFHPTQPLAFLVSELASTLTVLAITRDGDFEPLQTRSTLPTGTSDSLGGAIALNNAGDRIYVTNRGHDSIAVFAFDGTEVALLEHVSSGGASPRFLLPIEPERRMLVANEEGGTVALFAIEEDGRLTPRGMPLNIPGAVFLTLEPE